MDDTKATIGSRNLDHQPAAEHDPEHDKTEAHAGDGVLDRLLPIQQRHRRGGEQNPAEKDADVDFLQAGKLHDNIMMDYQKEFDRAKTQRREEIQDANLPTEDIRQHSRNQTAGL